MSSKLDQKERALLESFEVGEWRSVPGKDAEIERYRGYARATFRKDRTLPCRANRTSRKLHNVLKLEP